MSYGIEQMKELGIQRIYVISPYTHDVEEVMDIRYEEALRACGKLLLEGFHPLSVIVHCHPIAKVFDLPRDRQFWGDYDNTFITWAQAGYVLCFNYWWTSKGSKEDVMKLWSQKKPLFYSDPMNHVP